VIAECLLAELRIVGGELKLGTAIPNREALIGLAILY